MQVRTLGSSGIEASAVGLGCMGMSQSYGVPDPAEAEATLRRALEVGVTFFDTANAYGDGHNEELVGRVLGPDRDRIVLATKFGIIREKPGVDGDPAHVAGYCDASLARLGIDVIDLYYLHRVDARVPVEDTVGAMAELVRAGQGPGAGALRGVERHAAAGPGRPPHRRGAVRVLAVDPRRGEEAARHLRGAERGVRAVQPARPRLLHRGGDHAGVRQGRHAQELPPLPGRELRAEPEAAGRPHRSWPERSAQRPARSRWPG